MSRLLFLILLCLPLTSRAGLKHYTDFFISAQPDGTEWRYDMPGRIVVFGDIHNDVHALATILTGTGALDLEGNWISGTDHVVSLGDLIGKGPYSRATYDLFLHAKEQAERSKGQVHGLYGNHEQGLEWELYTRYLGEDDVFAYEDFALLPTEEEYRAHVQKMKSAALSLGRGWNEENERGVRALFRFERVEQAVGRAWSLPESPYARDLRTKNTILRIGEYLFIHAGVGDFLWQAPQSHVDVINAAYRNRMAAFQKVTLGDRKAKLSQGPMDWMNRSRMDSPIWSRNCADGEFQQARLEIILATMGAKHLLFAHSPTPSREIEKRYNGLAHNLDSGISVAIGGTITAAVITQDGITLHEFPREKHPLAERFIQRYQSPLRPTPGCSTGVVNQ